MKAIVDIKGGFGNQIFQYAFANHLRDLGYKVTINLQIKNNYIFDYQLFGFKKANIILVRFLKFIYRLSESKKINKKFIIFLEKFFKKYYSLEQFNPSNKKLINHFDGYWQDIEILKIQKSFVINSLRKIPQFEKAFSKLANPGSTLVHVRKGDYVSINEDLNIEYYQKALKHAQENIEGFTFEVFSDDILWITEQDCFSSAQKLHGPSFSPEKLIDDIAEMLNFENYIVSNSSFSLSIATLSEIKNSVIIVPSPWMRNSKKNVNLKKDWVKIQT